MKNRSCTTKFLAVLALVISSHAAVAQNMSDQDINLMTAATKGVNVYKKSGVGGLFAEVSHCYARLKGAAQPTKVEFCIAMDMSGVFIDDGAARANGFPRDKRFMDAEASGRMHTALMQSGISKSVADTQTYLGARANKIQRFTNLASQ